MAVVLVDTSVWIHFLAGTAPYANRLEELLTREEASGHELIYGELLIGDKGGRVSLLIHYRLIHQAAVVPHEEVAGFVVQRELHGRGIGWIDAHLLASALVSRLRFWTADVRLAEIAEQLGVGVSFD